jgi:hypothetical protein
MITTTFVILIVAVIVLAAIGIAAYFTAGFGIARLLETDATIKRAKQLNPQPVNGMVQSVGSVGTAQPEWVQVRPTQVCRGCGISAWLHGSDEEFQRCNKRANVMTRGVK